jgi:hypothetical protein
MGYIRADHVTVGMVLDLSWPASTTQADIERSYSWHVYAVDTRGVVPSRIPLRLVNLRTDETHQVSLNPDEQVWVTGWGVQPEDEVLVLEPEDEPTVFAWHPRYCFGTDLEVWMNERGQVFVGGTWTTGHYTTFANVPAEEVTVGVAEGERA